MYIKTFKDDKMEQDGGSFDGHYDHGYDNGDDREEPSVEDERNRKLAELGVGGGSGMTYASSTIIYFGNTFKRKLRKLLERFGG